MTSAVSSSPASLLLLGLDGPGPRAFLRVARGRDHAPSGRQDDGLVTVGEITTRLRALDAIVTQVVTAAPIVADLPDRADIVVACTLSTDVGADVLVSAEQRREAIKAIVDASARVAAPGGHVVVMSSVRAYGARAGNAVPLPDDSPVGGDDDGGFGGDVLALERRVEALADERPDLTITIVRPACIVGPGVDTSMTRHFEPRRLLVIDGDEPLWQFCHVDDLARAVLTCVERRLGGPVTVASPGHLSQTALEAISGRGRFEVPEQMAARLASRLHRLGMLVTSGEDLAFVRYPPVVSSQRIADAGWSAAYENRACVTVMLEEIRTNRMLASLRRDAVATTASAAVALAGRAALVGIRRRQSGANR